MKDFRGPPRIERRLSTSESETLIAAHCSPDQQNWMTESREPNADDDVGCLGRLSLSQTSMRQTARNIVSPRIIEKITINHVDYNFGRNYILSTTEENAWKFLKRYFYTNTTHHLLTHVNHMYTDTI